MTRDEKLRLAVSVARAAAHSGEYRRLDKLIEMVFQKLDQLAPSDDGPGDAGAGRDFRF